MSTSLALKKLYPIAWDFARKLLGSPLDCSKDDNCYPAYSFGALTNASLDTLNPAPIVNTTASAGEDLALFNCTDVDGPWRAKSLTSTTSCFKAIITSPRTARPGRFHRGGIRDNDQLPLARDYERCRLIIDFVSNEKPASDTGSWLGLAFSANLLTNACHYKERTGGTILAGDNSGIEIQLRKNPSVGEEGEDSLVDSDSTSTLPQPSLLAVSWKMYDNFRNVYLTLHSSIGKLRGIKRRRASWFWIWFTSLWASDAYVVHCVSRSSAFLLPKLFLLSFLTFWVCSSAAVFGCNLSWAAGS